MSHFTYHISTVVALYVSDVKYHTYFRDLVLFITSFFIVFVICHFILWVVFILDVKRRGTVR